ncbi:MAG: hypothetical protein WDO15_25000 [Bacteroidota bacterium]
MDKRRTVTIFLLLYVAIAAAVTVFHANNFSLYSDSEGAAEINYMEFVFFTSVLFQGLMNYKLKSINWKLAILSTVVNLLISIMLTILIVDWGEYSESAQQLIVIYGWCYMVIFSVTAWFQIRTSFV